MNSNVLPVLFLDTVINTTIITATGSSGIGNNNNNNNNNNK